MKIGLIVGSLRKQSWNRKVALVMKELLEKFNVESEIVEINDLPLYNPEREIEGVYNSYREEIKKYDGFIFFTPEYNRSYTPSIKNALDVASIGKEGNLFKNKPAHVISASMGGFGGINANLAIKQVFSYLALIPMQQPEVYLARIDTLFENGKLNDNTLGFLEKVAESFVKHANMVINGYSK